MDQIHSLHLRQQRRSRYLRGLRQLILKAEDQNLHLERVLPLKELRLEVVQGFVRFQVIYHMADRLRLLMNRMMYLARRELEAVILMALMDRIFPGDRFLMSSFR